MTIEKILLANSKLPDLETRLWMPKQIEGAILITHSWRNNMDEPVCADAAKYFYENNYAVLQLNLPGHAKKDFLRNTSFESIIQAINKATTFLRTESKQKRIFGLGISLGSAAIAYCLEAKFTAQALLSYSPLINPASIYERYKEAIQKKENELRNKGYIIITSVSGRGEFEIGQKWISETKDKAKYVELFNKTKVPTILVQGTEDGRYNYSTYKKFSEKHHAKNIIIKGADHNFTKKEYRNKMLPIIKKFFDNY